MKIGVLSLQGNFAVHIACLKKLNVEAIEVRTPDMLNDLAGLILPGGESSAMLRLFAEDDRWFPAFEAFYKAKKALFGTCAGIILLAKEVVPAQKSFKFLDVTVARNAYGAQLDSHMATVHLVLNGQEEMLELPLIRAPKILRVGAKVTPLGYVGEDIVLVEQERILGATCHPESVTTRVHEYFLNKCKS